MGRFCVVLALELINLYGVERYFSSINGDMGTIRASTAWRRFDPSAGIIFSPFLIVARRHGVGIEIRVVSGLPHARRNGRDRAWFPPL